MPYKLLFHTSVMFTIITSLAILLHCIGRHTSASATDSQAYITEGPVSVTMLVGATAQFRCAGTGNKLVWEVDGLQTDHSNIMARGITAATNTSSGTVQSILTVPATSVNNGTTVRCAVSVQYTSCQ